RSRLVELEVAKAPARELAHDHPRPVVRALGERDRPAGLEEGEEDARHRRGAGCEQERFPAFELAERLLGGGHGRAREARVRELPRRPVLVRPDRRPVDRGRHGATLSAAHARLGSAEVPELHDTTEAKLRWLEELRDESLEAASETHVTRQ